MSAKKTAKPKIGAPAKKRPKIRSNVSLSEETKAMFQCLADSKGISMSSLLTLWIREAHTQKKIAEAPEPIKAKSSNSRVA